ncbi:MFS transporter [Paraburkholderia sp. EG287A]|uniref:MFS transporter n=1 Tax=unclassified Paraburkholderia TaxID=2615204 RepID=UPI0034D23C2D
MKTEQENGVRAPCGSEVQRGGSVNGPSVDIDELLDGPKLSGIQWVAVILAALAAAMDGFDGQLIGFAIPSLLRDWAISREAVAPVVAAGLFGMAIGSVSVGALADRYGRRIALICSIGLFGLSTVAMGAARSVEVLAILRFLAGLGIGGALPCAAIIAVEFAPARLRSIVVTATVVSYPVGGIVAGLLSARLLSSAGWRGLFVLGGILPILFSFLLFAALPESPRYLVRQHGRNNELRRLLARIRGPIPDGTHIIDASEREANTNGQNVRLTDLYSRQWLRDSVALSAVFFMCLLALYSAYSWLPAMLVSAGMDARVASGGLTAYNLGGLVGALLCAWLVGRGGSRLILLGASSGAVSSAFLLSRLFPEMGAVALIVTIGVHGFFVSGVQGPMYALAAHLYPTEMRARGIGAATGFGRLGAIVSAFAGASIITLGGATGFFALLAVAMLLALLSIALIQRHIPPRERARTAAGEVQPG